MKLKVNVLYLFMATLPEPSGAAGASNPSGYVLGGIIALLILGYLVYTLIKPEKF